MLRYVPLPSNDDVCWLENSLRVSSLRSLGVTVSKGPVLTQDGMPWIRWASVDGQSSGCYATGTRAPVWNEIGPDSDFWDIVVALLTESGDGTLDACHCVGHGVLSVGGLGVTGISGYAQELLTECLYREPAVYLEIMRGLMKETDWWPTIRMDPTMYPTKRRGFEHFVRHIGLHERIKEGDSFRRAHQNHMRDWVACVSKLLGCPQMDSAQAAFAERCVPPMLSLPARARVLWPTNGARDAWQFSRDQHALWAVAMTIAPTRTREKTERLILETVQDEPIDARQSMRRMRDYSDDLSRIVERACSVFQIDLEAR